MNIEDSTKQIVELTDERNYLRNIIEASNETGKTIEETIYDRLADITTKLVILEEDMPF